MEFRTQMAAVPEHTSVTSADRATDAGRRAFDLVVGGSLLLLTAPLVVIAALGSAVALRAWPFFWHERIGRHGDTFRFLKVRTLPTTVPAYLDKHHLPNDEIPAFCRFLRRRHLDELPQLALVLSGRMSLVGPRPEMPYLHDRMDPAFRQARTSVRPGCTGLWQLSDACIELLDAVPGYDRFYLEHRSLRLDLWIVMRTLRNMLGLGECITLDDVAGWALHAPAADVVQLRDASASQADGIGESPVRLPATASR